MDSEIAAIRDRSDASITAFSRQVQKELRKQPEATAKLADKVSENFQQTERVRLQVLEVGHRVDTQHVSNTKQIEELTELVNGLGSDSRGGATEAREGSVGPAGAGSSRDKQFLGSAARGVGGGGDLGADMLDRAVLRAITHADVGRVHVHAQFAAFLAARTTVPTRSADRTRSGHLRSDQEGGRPRPLGMSTRPFGSSETAQDNGDNLTSQWAVAARHGCTSVEIGRAPTWFERSQERHWLRW